MNIDDSNFQSPSSLTGFSHRPYPVRKATLTVLVQMSVQWIVMIHSYHLTERESIKPQT